MKKKNKENHFVNNIYNLQEFISFYRDLIAKKDTQKIEEILESLKNSNNPLFIVSSLRLSFCIKENINKYKDYLIDAYFKLIELNEDPKRLLIGLITPSEINHIMFIRNSKK